MKQVKDYYDQFDTCREHDIPACSDACPFKLDILTIQERISKKRINAAYKTYRDCVAFPGIVARLCPAYCQQACIRSLTDEPLQIKRLEQSVVSLTKRKDPNAYNLPVRDVKIGVIGAGISGMAFALKMASRKYSVTVFEKEQQIGGQLAGLMDEDEYMAEFDLQFKHEKYELKTGAEAELDSETGIVTAGGEEYRFDLVYIATGAGGSDFGTDTCKSITAGDEKTGVFTGGSLRGKDLMNALADGINIAAAADDFIKAGILEYPKAARPSKCVADEDKITDTPAVVPADGDAYSEEECIAEAQRCIRCSCNACEKYCDLIDYYEKWPVKMRDEIFLSVKPAGSLVHKSPARKYIAACTECGIMEETCPENIRLCEMIKSARHQMHEADKMPAAYRQYYLRDMEFANSEYAAVVKKGSAKYAFFPGCNLGALDPDYVIKPYGWLTENYPETGLLLRCCSIPVDWAGKGGEHQEALEQLKKDWESLGKPVLVTACLSCDKHLHDNLPEIETVTLYELMAQTMEKTGSPKAGSASEETYAVFDPCAARGCENVQTAVRNLAGGAGISTCELPKGDLHGCCGFGGQGDIAQPDFAEYVADKRAAASDRPYLVYCSNCRDVFASKGKPAVHILDVLFDIDPDNARPNPTVTQRRRNRVELKEKLLEEFWSETMSDKPARSEYVLIMSDEIAAKVEKQHILEEDICSVIERSERTGRRTRNPENGHYKAYNEIGAITLWVEYSMSDAGAEIHNVYTHRMQIKLEAVFNGRKIEE